jgi:hypothetical protein
MAADTLAILPTLSSNAWWVERHWRTPLLQSFALATSNKYKLVKGCLSDYQLLSPLPIQSTTRTMDKIASM